MRGLRGRLADIFPALGNDIWHSSAVQRDPVIYEINTWPWLTRLGRELGHPVTLGSVPDHVWDAIGLGPIDAVWLMGVWQRSPAGVRIALSDEPLVETFHESLGDFTPDDVVGSPYCIRDYRVDDHLGGPDGLAIARRALAERGIGLILDFVPNHLATDHPWALENPERFVGGNAEDLAAHPSEFVLVGKHIIAHARDPHFAPWRDVLQLNAFHAAVRRGAVDALTAIAVQADGVRVDMAMLMCNDIFAATWADRVGATPAVDYWSEVIPALREASPDFVFIAESYWGTEGILRSQGFDYCYDKTLTDALEHHPHDVAAIIAADTDRAGKVHFIENHDEPRAQSVFGGRHRAAAITALTQPGARLIYDGQTDGRMIRLPVQLAREPDEPVRAELRDFYREMLCVLSEPALHTGVFSVLPVTGWPDNPPGAGLTAWSWTSAQARWLIVVNLDDAAGAGRVHTDWPELVSAAATLIDPIAGDRFHRPPDPDQDIFVMLPAWGAHVLSVQIDT